MYEIADLRKKEGLSGVQKVSVSIFIIILVGLIMGKILFSKGVINIFEERSADFVSEEVYLKSTQSMIYVDIAGAVLSPGVYELSDTARLRDLLKLAGGISTSSDPEYITKELNLAQKLSDGSKIYIPFLSDGFSTASIEKSKDITTTEPTSSHLGNINDMTYDELVSLDGIGEAYANRILLFKPYKSYEELIEKTKIPSKVLDSIKGKFEFK